MEVDEQIQKLGVIGEDDEMYESLDVSEGSDWDRSKKRASEYGSFAQLMESIQKENLMYLGIEGEDDEINATGISRCASRNNSISISQLVDVMQKDNDFLLREAELSRLEDELKVREEVLDAREETLVQREEMIQQQEKDRNFSLELGALGEEVDTPEAKEYTKKRLEVEELRKSLFVKFDGAHKDKDDELSEKVNALQRMRDSFRRSTKMTTEELMAKVQTLTDELKKKDEEIHSLKAIIQQEGKTLHDDTDELKKKDEEIQRLKAIIQQEGKTLSGDMVKMDQTDATQTFSNVAALHDTVNSEAPKVANAHGNVMPTESMGKNGEGKDISLIDGNVAEKKQLLMESKGKKVVGKAIRLTDGNVEKKKQVYNYQPDTNATTIKRDISNNAEDVITVDKMLKKIKRKENEIKSLQRQKNSMGVKFWFEDKVRLLKEADTKIEELQLEVVQIKLDMSEMDQSEPFSIDNEKKKKMDGIAKLKEQMEAEQQQIKVIKTEMECQRDFIEQTETALAKEEKELNKMKFDTMKRRLTSFFQDEDKLIEQDLVIEKKSDVVQHLQTTLKSEQEKLQELDKQLWKKENLVNEARRVALQRQKSFLALQGQEASLSPAEE